jgi:spermidine synthase
MNVPAPLTAQTATLYSSAFYASVKAKLNSGGVLAVSLTRPLRLDNTVARRIAAGVLENFKHAIAITPQSVGITFVFASDALPFTIRGVEQMLRDTGEKTFAIMDETALRLLVGTAAPITLDSLNVALEESARRVRNLLEP